MTNNSHCIWGIAISLALHVAAICFWRPDFLQAEKLHVTGEIEFLSLMETKKEKPPAPKRKAVEPPRIIPKKRVVRKKAAPVMKPLAMKDAPKVPVAVNEAPRPAIAKEVAPIVESLPAPAQPKEAVVLSPAEMTRLYASRVRERIEACKDYPKRARKQHLEGAIRVRFVLTPKGDVKKITIVRGCRFAALNTAAKNAVLSAAPFPSLPEHMAKEPISMEVTLCFELT